MNILICDDLKTETDSLAALIANECTKRQKELGFNVSIVTFTDSRDVLDYYCRGEVIDVCFLDIIMPLMNGVELAEKLRLHGYNGEIIFLTTSNEYATESYRVKAFDYLVKPPTAENVQEILNALKNTGKNADKNGIFVKTQRGSRFIQFDNISYAEVVKHTVYLRLTGGGEIAVYTSFTKIAGLLLGDKRFMQCHRSYIVNVSKIETVAKRYANMQDGAKVPISRGFSAVKDKMLKYMFSERKQND